MAEIAVIVPVYKVESYLCRCVDSILSQTFSDFDLILVDDGSPDRCPEICDTYAKQDSRVHVIHQENGGLSSARNSGILWANENSASKYLTFVDSDDWLHTQYLERLYIAVINNDVAISMCYHKYVSAHDAKDDLAQHKETSMQSISPENLLLLEPINFNYAWGKLYEKKCFDTLRYPVGMVFEDTLTTYRAMFSCANIVLVKDHLYYYFNNPNGITKSPWTPKSLQCFAGIEAQLDFYRANGYDRAYRKATELYIQQCAYQIHRIHENKADLEKNCLHLKNLKARMRNMLHCSEYSLRGNFYWYEALHPLTAKVWSIMMRIIRNLKENGLAGTLRKLTDTVR